MSAPLRIDPDDIEQLVAIAAAVNLDRTAARPRVLAAVDAYRDMAPFDLVVTARDLDAA